MNSKPGSLLRSSRSSCRARRVSRRDQDWYSWATGPIESTVAQMAPGAELAIKEVSDSGKLLGSAKVKAVRGDTAARLRGATAAARRLSDGVKAIVGGKCSGVTTAALKNVAKPNGVDDLASATSPALSTIEDNGLFFRTAPSDASGRSCG